MATDAQKAIVQLKDPLAYQAVTSSVDPAVPGTTLDDAIDSAITQLNRTLYRNQFDTAVALLAICTIRRQNPNIGAGFLAVVSETSGGSRTKRLDRLPKGFPAHWYTCPAGEELIGLTQSLSPPSFG